MKSLLDLFLECKSVSTDSRNLPEGCIFFALKGPMFNGNKFAKSALEKGAKYAVIDEKEYKVDDRYIVVNNVLEALQDLANQYRETLSIPFLGITGSNGKTTTKELIKCVIEEKYHVSATKGNLNNHIGVPLTLLSITNESEFAIIEMGANGPNDIGELCAIANPDFGIITNIGRAHLEGFGGFDGVIKAKTQLYHHIKEKNGMLFLNQDDDVLFNAAKDIKSFTYGRSESNITGRLVEQTPHLLIEWSNARNTYLVQTQITGGYNFYNVLAAICIGSYFEVADEKINEAIAAFIPSMNRSEVIKTDKNTLLLDAYNANPSSMIAALESFKTFPGKNKTLILGDMFELGEASEIEHKKIYEYATSNGFDQIILVGEIFGEFVPENNLNFKSTDELIEYLKTHPISDHSILIKGSRGIKLEPTQDYL